MTTITTLPTPPSREDPLNFADRADAFLGALPTFGDQANLVAAEINANATAASTAETQAEAAAAAALATANTTLWVSGTTYAQGVVTYSPITFLSYRRKIAGAGTTDPSADATNWQLVAGSGDVTLTGTQTLTNKTIVSPLETKVVLANGAIDTALGSFFTRTVAANTTFSVTNVPSAGSTRSLILELTNAGAFTITWWANIKWAGGTAPTLTSAGRDILGFYTHDAGTTWNGLVLAKDIK